VSATEPVRRPVADPPPLPEKAKPRPGPPNDPELAPYFAAAAEGRVLVQRCDTCGHAQLYPRCDCVRCHSTVHWEDASGFGTVYSFTVIRQHFARQFRHLLPLVVALVDLDEGPRLMTNLVELAPEDARVGMRVEVRFERVGDEAAIALFAPAPDA
jgi:uncharacterized OB-fold protein